jgi:hypothetical protein
VSFTFAVMGRNEAERLATAVGQALEAAESEDEVVFVDGDSDDGSAEIAAGLGVTVLPAPEGKGRAVALVLAEADTEHVVFVDADIEASALNIPAELRATAERTGADLVVGEFDWPERPLLNTVNVYRPLVAALFPEAIEPVGSVPFSGFRALRRELDWGSIPPGFGVETHLNLVAAAGGARIATTPLGRYHGPVRAKPTLGLEVGGAILDRACATGRLGDSARASWDEWLGRVVAAIAAGDPEGAAGAAARPLPPRR